MKRIAVLRLETPGRGSFTTDPHWEWDEEIPFYKETFKNK